MGAHYDDVAEGRPVDHYIRSLARRARARLQAEGDRRCPCCGHPEEPDRRPPAPLNEET